MYPVNFRVDHNHEEVLVKNYIITMESSQDMLPQLVLSILLKSFDLGNYIKMEKSLKFGTVYIYIVYVVSLPFIFLYEIKEKIVIEIGPRLNPFTLITIGGSTTYYLASNY